MTPYQANPVMYILGILILGGFLLFAGFYAIDRVGLEVTKTKATVTGKQFTAGGKTYTTNIVNGRPLVQSRVVPDAYAVSLDVGGERALGVVSQSQYEALREHQRVQVAVQRTRLTGTLEVIELSR